MEIQSLFVIAVTDAEFLAYMLGFAGLGFILMLSLMIVVFRMAGNIKRLTARMEILAGHLQRDIPVIAEHYRTMKAQADAGKQAK